MLRRSSSYRKNLKSVNLLSEKSSKFDMKRSVVILIVLLSSTCNSDDVLPEPEVIGTVIAYNCFKSFGVTDDGSEIALSVMGEMFGSSFINFNDGRPTFMAICEAYKKGDQPCPLKSYYGFNLKISNESISEQYKITTWKADDGVEFELKEALDDEGMDYFITPERSGNLFLRTGYSCVGKKKFSLRGVDTDSGKLWLTNPVP
jgi:hypothetical protein